ncbi:MAG TPA: transglycosylase domain-containing protein [Kofleriaceae bacterium]|nr:transglycosylase domain-containing protein [Kofleriaceae bacterium]
MQCERALRVARLAHAVRRTWRIARWSIVIALVPAVIAIHAAVIAVLALPYDRAQLAPTSEPLALVDRRGEPIATLAAQGADRLHWTRLGDLPAIAVSAVIESEDEHFWRHRGVDGAGVARAVWLDLHGGRFGGSTLTMQLARMLIDDGAPRGGAAKLRESLLALRIERAADKRAILEQWMNRAYFGNGAYGFEAAARLYFGKPASALSDGEATLLAVIPRAPTGYDPLVHVDAALRRRDRVLDLLIARGVIDGATARAARATPIAVWRHDPPSAAPHFTRWITGQLSAAQRRAGGTVHTTLDLQLQRTIERRVAERVAELGHRGLEQAGVVVLDTRTTEVRAMVGSTSWLRSQLNATTRRRHPGSALKPFVYAAAIEQGASPASIAWDTRDASDAYFAPAGGVEHGPVRFRQALASSYNFAAIAVLEQVGIPRVMTALRTAGVAELPGTPRDYGLRLALGAAKVRLIDLAAGYGFTVKGGLVGTPHGITSIDLPGDSPGDPPGDSPGDLPGDSPGDPSGTPHGSGRWLPPPALERRVFSPQTSWLVMDMLADPEARRPGFGMELAFDLPFRVAAKTGTARGFSDTWAIGATREVIAGAWAGTLDGTSTQGVVGMDAAAPLVRDALLAAAGGAALTLPPPPEGPDGVDPVEVCAVSGMAPGPHCPRVHDHVAHGRAPTEPCTWHDAAGRLTYPDKAKHWLARHPRP